MTGGFSTTITINSDTGKVWNTLTNAKLMKKWMGEPEMKIEVDTDWAINSPILISGFHHIKFVNKGLILQYDKEKKLKYSHLSSVSRLPDITENYTVLEFVLIPLGKKTQLTLNIENFPTETIRKHLEFYWRTTVVMIKEAAEND